MSAEVARPRSETSGTGFVAILRKILNVYVFIPTKQKEVITREMEAFKASSEGDEVILAYGLKTDLRRVDSIFSEYIKAIPKGVSEIEDPRIVIDVSSDVFEKIVQDKNISYVCQEMDEKDNSGKSGWKTIFAATENKLRIKTEMGEENPFYKNIIFPSYIAQRTIQIESLAGRETSPEEVSSLDRQAGFSALNVLDNSLTRVKKIKLLSPLEAQKFKGAVPLYNIRKDRKYIMDNNAY